MIYYNYILLYIGIDSSVRINFCANTVFNGSSFVKQSGAKLYLLRKMCNVYVAQTLYVL